MFRLLKITMMMMSILIANFSWASKGSDEDAKILLEFKRGITHDPLHALGGWNAGNKSLFCDWKGVKCTVPRNSLQIARVSELNLTSNNLEGWMTPALGGLLRLSSLDLSNNHLSGSIPRELGFLRNLHILDLSNNSLAGAIPDTLANCTNLMDVRIYTNNLTGGIPFEFGMLTNVQQLFLWENQLTGLIPRTLGNCTTLTELDLDSNQLSGEIPLELAMLPNLQFLHLWGNQLTGLIPSNLGNCTTLTSLDLNSNQLSGEIPLELAMLPNLTFLYLWGNQLTGLIPSNLGICTTLTELDLDSNQLSGEIPLELAMLPNLQFLHLKGNQLTGLIPSNLGNCTSLSDVDLYSNELIGAIPSELGQLGSLQVLYLSDNNLSGTIPPEISNCTRLFYLDLSYNMLNGAVPKHIGQLQELRYLHLKINMLTGVIPETLSSCFRLTALDLSSNSLTGSTPSSFSELSSLALLDLSGNALSGSIPSGLGGLFMVGTIDLSDNLLSGTIPRSIADCVELSFLDLSKNNLTGEIQVAIGNLKSLSVLNLSFNNLTGGLPSFLGRMPSLAYLNVSFNGLTGEIPNVGLFTHLNVTSFLGNPGLCGPILHKVCDVAISSHDRDTLSLRSKLVIIVTTTSMLLLLGGLLWYLICFTPRGSVSSSYILRPTFRRQERFTAEDLWIATEGYHEKNVLGAGGFSVVYKGVLPDNRVIAVKKLKDARSYDIFTRELRILGRLRHRNLVKILGYVSTLEVKALVLEFVSNGSLERHLHEGGSCRLSWEARLKAAIAVAQVLAYLHHDYGQPVLHGDLKPGNILFDSDFDARLTDFGTARLFTDLSSGGTSLQPSSTFKGSIGYIAPECAYSTQVSVKADVFSYGVILLEMLTARRPTDENFAIGMSLSQWVRSYFPDKAIEILDEALRCFEITNPLHSIRLMGLALACTEENPSSRPTMKQVLSVLQKIETGVDNAFLNYPALENLASTGSTSAISSDQHQRNVQGQSSSI